MRNIIKSVPLVLRAALPLPPSPPVATTNRCPTSVSSPTIA